MKLLFKVKVRHFEPSLAMATGKIHELEVKARTEGEAMDKINKCATNIALSATEIIWKP